MPLGAGREFDRVRAISRALGARAALLGDDCAILPDGAGALVLSTDVSVEGVHFRREWLTLEEIGWRACAAALSDLAAEGARVVGVVAAVVMPAGTSDADAVALMNGVGAAAAGSGGLVLGGDLSGGTAWSVAITVMGRAERPVTRAGAEPGDAVWVTGTLGGARAAVSEWRHGRVPVDSAREAFAHPLPRVTAGRWLAAHGARAMLDVSDGLVADARHLSAASGVAIDLDLDLLPQHAAVAAAADAAGEDAALFAAAGGEDFELLVALPPEFDGGARDLFVRECGVELTRVGRVRVGAGVRALRHGSAVEVAGFDHVVDAPPGGR